MEHKATKGGRSHAKSIELHAHQKKVIKYIEKMSKEEKCIFASRLFGPYNVLAKQRA